MLGLDLNQGNSNDRFSFVGSHWKSVLNIEVKMQPSFLFEKSITGTVFHNDSNDKSIFFKGK